MSEKLVPEENEEIRVQKLGDNFSFHCRGDFIVGSKQEKENIKTYKAYLADCKARRVVPFSLYFLETVEGINDKDSDTETNNKIHLPYDDCVANVAEKQA